MKKRPLSNRELQRLREKALKILRENGTETPDTETHDLLRLTHELEVYNIELEIQNEELRRAKKESEVAQQEFFELYEFAPTAYLTLDKEGRIERVNRAAIQMLNRDPKRILGFPFTRLIDLDDLSVFLSYMTQIQSNRGDRPVELRLRGEERPIHVIMKGMAVSHQEDELKWLWSIVDISALKQAENALEESKLRHRNLFESIEEGICIVEIIFDEFVKPFDFRFLEVNPAFEKQTGLAHAKGRRMRELAPGHEAHWVEAWGRVALTGLPARFEYRAGHTQHWFALSAFRIGHPKDMQVAVILNDITDRKLKEEAIYNYKEELEIQVENRTDELKRKTEELERINTLLKQEIKRRRGFESDLKARGDQLIQAFKQRDNLSRRLVGLLERERREIGNALHEEIGQIMAGVMLQLEGLKNPQVEDSAGFKNRVSGIQNALRGAVSQARRISHDLRSEVLERHGLIPAIKELVTHYRKDCHLKIDLFMKGLPEASIADEKDVTIYRVVQESLSNVVKHARADNVYINLIKRDRWISLTVEDNGEGFFYDGVSKNEDRKDRTLGLVIMRERVNQVGGQFYIETAPGRGTLISAEIPLDTEHHLMKEVEVG